jgi:hypothetical protein
MKTLQKNYTTAEQSKRLLDLGVPADSADCWIAICGYEIPTFLEVPYSEQMKRLVLLEPTECSPCWSVGRLIEIAFICSEVRTIDFWRNDIPINDIIYEFEDNKMDFSKLED